VLKILKLVKKFKLLKMPKLIEIIGPPGSGKTFISLELQNTKKKNKQIYFHSSDWRNFAKFKNLNILNKIIIKIKVAIIIINFFTKFYKRLFYKKAYKREFFFRTILLIYRHLHSIEMLKKVLSDNEFLIMEPGIIMYFLQDYFYTNESISKKEIENFNKFFMKTNFIIYTFCSSELQLKRLKIRNRGLPQRMKNLNNDEIERAVKKANYEIKNYLTKSNNLKSKIIKIDTSKKIKEIKEKIFRSIK